MNENKRKALVGRLVDLAGKLVKYDSALPVSIKFRMFLSGQERFVLAGEDAAAFEETCSVLLQRSGWSDKYSESHVVKLLSNLLGQLHEENTTEKAEEFLSNLEDEYRSYSKDHAVIVLLSGIVTHDCDPRIGQVTIRKTTKESLKERLGIHARTAFGRQILEQLADAVVAEFSTVAEPVRAKERAVEETRRAVDVLRYSIPFIVSTDYKRLGMNVGIVGDYPDNSAIAVVLPSPDDNSMTFLSDSRGPAIPYRLDGDTVKELGDCGAMDVGRILEKPTAFLTNFERVLLRGIHWFANGLCQTEPENELLSLITCLETFLTPKDGNPIGTAIAEGVALLLEDTLEERKKMKKKVQALYRQRSAVSHGGEKAVLEANLADLREIVKRTVRRMISLSGSIRSQKELLDSIEDQKLA